MKTTNAGFLSNWPRTPSAWKVGCGQPAAISQPLLSALKPTFSPSSTHGRAQSMPESALTPPFCGPLKLRHCQTGLPNSKLPRRIRVRGPAPRSIPSSSNCSHPKSIPGHSPACDTTQRHSPVAVKSEDGDLHSQSGERMFGDFIVGGFQARVERIDLRALHGA